MSTNSNDNHDDELDEDNPINLPNYVKQLSGRYDSKPDGAQNEGIQNPLDEFDSRDDKNHLKIKITYDPDEKTLEFRDNAGGMDRETLKSQFMTFEEGTKTRNTKTRGSQGQGGAVFLQLGNDVVEIETLKDGERTSAKWTPERRGFDYGFKQLDEEGTVIRVKEVKEKFDDSFKNFSEMERLIQRYWQSTLERDDVTITYEVVGFIEEREIEPFDIESLDIEKEVEEENIEVLDRADYDDLPEDVQEKGKVEIEKFHLYIFEEERPEVFKNVLAMNVYGQTIEWRMPQRVNSRHRVLAFAEVPDIRSLDYPSHRGFKDKKVPTEVKKRLSDLVREHTDELKDNTDTTEQQDEGIREARRKLNKHTEGTVFEELYDDFSPDGDEEPDENGTDGDIDNDEQENPYPIQGVIQERGTNPSFGDNLNLSVDVKNPKGQGYDVGLEIEFLYPLSKKQEVENELIDHVEKEIYVKGNKVKNAGTFEFKIPENTEIEGRYRLRVKAHTEHKKTTETEQSTFYIEIGEDEENPSDDAKTSGSDKLDSIELGRAGGDWKASFKVIQDNRGRDRTQIWINATHPSFDRNVNTKGKNQIRDYVYEASLLALSDHLSNIKVDEFPNKPEKLRNKLEEIQKDRDLMDADYSENQNDNGSLVG